jgi:hypothetical protein
MPNNVNVQLFSRGNNITGMTEISYPLFLDSWGTNALVPSRFSSSTEPLVNGSLVAPELSSSSVPCSAVPGHENSFTYQR